MFLQNLGNILIFNLYYRSLTFGQLIFEILKLFYKSGKGIVFFVYLFLLTLLRFIFYLMSGIKEEESDLQKSSKSQTK